MRLRFRFFRPRFVALACALALPALLLGCAQTRDALGYYWQSAHGHAQLLGAARPLDDWIAQPNTPPALRTRLQLAQRARAFAVAELHLPDNASYRRYADLKRPAAVWNVVAAPPDALTLHTWCFPVTGCIGYRGYFAQADAQAEADRLAAQGLEVDVYGVPAYSTLGYMNWAGGDPLLSTFVGWPEGDFVRLLFHELAHQVVYAQGDTVFNESFATAVERLGSARWMAEHSTREARAALATSEQRRAQWRALTRATRTELQAIYEKNEAPGQDTQALAAIKNEAMQRFRAGYAQLRSQWLAAAPTPNTSAAPPPNTQLAGYDRWVAKANNASFAAQAAYDELVPAFEALFEREGRDWLRFYDAVRQLTQLPQPERHAALRALAKNPQPLTPPKEKPGV
ncbi:MAG: aminopeptidase [Acidovorax sp.]|nr:aminopeptidase [Acidovorax sp.]